VQLQDVDVQIYTLKSKKDTEIPRELESLKNEFENRKKDFEIFSEKLKQSQLKKKEKELELATKEENVKKAQGQLFQLKSNKEYHAKLTEIASLKADVSLLEEDVIKALDEIESADKKVKEGKETLAGEDKKYKERETQLNGQLAEIDAQIKSLEEKKGNLAKDIDKRILTKYEKLVQTRGGRAMAPVNSDTENCGACNIRVTAQKIKRSENVQRTYFLRELRKNPVSAGGFHLMIKVFIDGASAGNPGNVGIGYLIYRNGELIKKTAFTLAYKLIISRNIWRLFSLLRSSWHGRKRSGSFFRQQTPLRAIKRKLQGKKQNIYPLFVLAKTIISKLDKFSVNSY
jgi:predicted  nucleic acid-binding Zn-ribbon protein